ncbi:MAG: GspE/PulE family protein [Gemmatimonadota bacterium]
MIPVAERLPFNAEYLEYYGVLPLARMETGYTVATWFDAVTPRVLDDLRLRLETEPILVRFGEEEIRDAIRRVYAPESLSAEELLAEMPGAEIAVGDDAAIDDLFHLANEAPVIKLVNLLLIEALEARSSDVHIESRSDGLRTRYRIDGVLQDAASPPAHLRAAVVSRQKIMADLDIAERRLPQDGRIRLHLRNRDVDVRVSTVPTLHGESVVLRLLDKSRGRIELTGVGMSAEVEQAFRQVIARPHGIVLATGPTGSGKTTSLYAAVDAIRTGSEKILTVEDPVEYELAGVPQMQVNEKSGLTFATALRSLLRQDPDVILVGEIRDADTAEIATQAALTGHLVLSTLHTNDAATAITRLLDLGVPAYLVSSTVEAVLAQRLVRTICPLCRSDARLDSRIIDAFGELLNDVESYTIGHGCAECRGTGYYGRTGIYELLLVDEVIRSEIARGTTTDRLRDIALRQGMRTLRADGVRLILEGATTPEEILRVTRQ